MRWSFVLLIFGTTLQAQEIRLTPAQAVLLAYGDCSNLSPEIAQDTRYLWLPNLPKEVSTPFRVILNAHCNQLSNQALLEPLREVKESGRQVLAVYLPNYGWKAETWDQFSENEPYFYTTLELIEQDVYERQYWQGGYENGQYYAPGWYRIRKAGGKKKRRVLSPWLVSSPGGKQAVEGLSRLTYAQVPIVNAVYFFQSTATSGDGRKPDYYDFLGVKDEKSFQELLGVQLERDRKWAEPLLEAVGRSGITQEPRAIERLEKIGGAYWRSHDVIKGTAKDLKNALRVYGTNDKGELIFKADATEQYGHLPNGLWAFGLFNAKGEKQASAPDTIASSSVEILHNDHRVLVGPSCIGCHTNGGLQDIKGWARSNLSLPNLSLLYGDREGKKYDPKDFIKLRQQYGRKLEPYIENDRKRYSAALLEITLLKPEEYAKEYISAWKFCADSEVGLNWASRELGCTEEQLKKAIQYQVDLKKADPVLAPLIEGNLIGLTQWYELYPLAQQYLLENSK